MTQATLSYLSFMNAQAALGLFSQAQARGCLEADHLERLARLAAREPGLLPETEIQKAREMAGAGCRRQALRSLFEVGKTLRETLAQKMPPEPEPSYREEIAARKTPEELVSALRGFPMPEGPLWADLVNDYFEGEAVLEAVPEAFDLRDRAWEISRDLFDLQERDIISVRAAGLELRDIVERPWRRFRVTDALRGHLDFLCAPQSESPDLDRLAERFKAWGSEPSAGLRSRPTGDGHLYLFLEPSAAPGVLMTIGCGAALFERLPEAWGLSGMTLGVIGFQAEELSGIYRTLCQTHLPDPQLFKDGVLPFGLPLSDPDGRILHGAFLAQETSGDTHFLRQRLEALQKGLEIARVLERSRMPLRWSELYRLFAWMLLRHGVFVLNPAFQREDGLHFGEIPPVAALAAERGIRKKFAALDEAEWDGIVRNLALEAAAKAYEAADKAKQWWNPPSITQELLERAVEESMEELLKKLEERRSRPNAARLLHLLRGSRS